MWYELLSESNVAELEVAEQEFDAAFRLYELATTKKARRAAKDELLYARARYLESLKNYTDFFQNWR